MQLGFGFFPEQREKWINKKILIYNIQVSTCERVELRSPLQRHQTSLYLANGEN